MSRGLLLARTGQGGGPGARRELGDTELLPASQVVRGHETVFLLRTEQLLNRRGKIAHVDACTFRLSLRRERCIKPRRWIVRRRRIARPPRLASLQCRGALCARGHLAEQGQRRRGWLAVLARHSCE